MTFANITYHSLTAGSAKHGELGREGNPGIFAPVEITGTKAKVVSAGF